jgi:LmbE family N-acetylglucosaminyl deacetylase
MGPPGRTIERMHEPRSTSTPELGTILSVWAHPDDETYLAAGLMASARDRGARVVCVTATAGERGTDDPIAWPPHRLGNVRRWEALAAMAVLGVEEHHVLGYADGELDPDDAHAIAEVVRYLDDVRPDTILTFGADGMTFHPDHIAVHHWVTTAWFARGCRERLLYATVTREFLARHREELERWDMYMSDERPIGVAVADAAVHLELAGDELDRKLTALRAMATQTGALIAALDPDVYAEHVREECFVAARPAPGSARPFDAEEVLDRARDVDHRQHQEDRADRGANLVFAERRSLGDR